MLAGLVVSTRPSFGFVVQEAAKIGNFIPDKMKDLKLLDLPHQLIKDLKNGLSIVHPHTNTKITAADVLQPPKKGRKVRISAYVLQYFY